MNKHAVQVTINGTEYKREVEPRLLLSDFLRHELGLTGTHVGCEHGVCGACTVIPFVKDLDLRGVDREDEFVADIHRKINRGTNAAGNLSAIIIGDQCALTQNPQRKRVC